MAPLQEFTVRMRAPEWPGRRLGIGARRSALALAASLTLASTAHAVSAQPEVQLTASAIPDNEYDFGRKGAFCPTCNLGDGNARWAFTDPKGNLWLAKLDYQTGAFVPTDGHGQLLDIYTAPVTCFGNGPEWMSSAAGSQIVYTRFTDGSPWKSDGTLDCTLGTPQVAIATQTASGWVTSVLSNSQGKATPEGTLYDPDTDPRIDYIEANKTALYWRSRSAPDVEHEMPINDLTGGNSRRWVAGTHKIIFQGHLNSDPRLLDQVWTFDTDSNQREQLTFDNVTKSGGFMWRAPEFNNEYVFFTMANFRQEIWVYRNLTGPHGIKRWTVIKKILAPKQFVGDTTKSQFFFSPEPFTHNGRSYIFTQVSESSKFFDKSQPTNIAISGIDPLNTDFRLLTFDTPTTGKPRRVRLDPEYFITAKGPFIYYNRLVPATTQYPDGINDGVWRVDTTLGPPKF